jgi:hypothetical protein
MMPVLLDVAVEEELGRNAGNGTPPLPRCPVSRRHAVVFDNTTFPPQATMVEERNKATEAKCGAAVRPR